MGAVALELLSQKLVFACGIGGGKIGHSYLGRMCLNKCDKWMNERRLVTTALRDSSSG